MFPLSFLSPACLACRSGFTGSGYPKVVPPALAKQAAAYNKENPGKKFRISLLTGASTAPELDGALAEIDAIERRMPYNGDPIVRKRMNEGRCDYVDMHLSHSAPSVWSGVWGKMDVAVVEVTAVREDGLLLPSTSIGNNKTYLAQADKVILEVNSHQKMELEGMHDIYYGTALPPNRKPIPIVGPNDRFGDKFLRVDPAKVVAVVETDHPDRNNVFAPLDDTSKRIAGHIMEFFENEVRMGRLPKTLLPLQSGVGNGANAVMAGA